MSTPSNISARGQIQNTLHMGFTDQDATHELLDNCGDAGATRIRLRFNTATTTLCVDCNGVGMDEATLFNALCFHNTRAASGAIGLRGFGLKAGLIVLSDAESTTRIFSRTATTEVVEACVNWPQAINDNIYNPRVNGLTVTHSDEWKNGALDASHGTVVVIPMTKTHFDSLLSKLPSMLDEMGRTYEDFIRKGLSISVVVDGKSYAPDFSTAVGWEDTPQHFRKEVAIEVLRNVIKGEDRVYYFHVCGKPQWEDMVRDDPATPKKMLRDYQTAKNEGFVCIGKTTLRSTYSNRWNPTTIVAGNRVPYVPGYMSLCRAGRHLRALPTEFSASGDYEKRRVIAAARHALHFTHEEDVLFDMSVNKSLVVVDHIHPGLLAVVQRLTKEWAGRVYDRHFKPKPAVVLEDIPKRHLKLAMKMLKSIAEQGIEDWYESFGEWVANHTDDASVDDTATVDSLDV